MEGRMEGERGVEGEREREREREREGWRDGRMEGERKGWREGGRAAQPPRGGQKGHGGATEGHRGTPPRTLRFPPREVSDDFGVLLNVLECAQLVVALNELHRVLQHLGQMGGASG